MLIQGRKHRGSLIKRLDNLEDGNYDFMKEINDLADEVFGNLAISRSKSYVVQGTHLET